MELFNKCVRALYARVRTREKKISSFFEKKSKMSAKGLIFLSNYIKM